MAIAKTDFIWLDGKLVRWDDARLPFLTHTLHYGMAIFEGIRVYPTARGPAVFRLREHMKRMAEGALITGMACPWSVDDMCRAVVEILRANRMETAYVRPLLYYGDDVGMGLGTVNTTHLGIATFQWGAYLGEEALANGIRAKISSFPRRPVHSIPSKAKVAGGYVNSIMAKREAQLAGYDEAVMLDNDGYVAEATGENLFMVREGALWTPPDQAAILMGITRDSILRIARRMNLPVREQMFTRDLLYTADECFLTGTAAEVTPVREVDDRRIGTGTAGPVTRELQQAFFRAARGEDPAWREWLTPV